MGKEYSSDLQDKRESKKRWVILIFCCLSLVGNSYCVDNIGVLYDCLKEQFITLGDSFDYFFGLLYSVSSLPNIVVPFFGGILITILGDRVMYIAFGVLIMLGQFLIAFGSAYNSIGWMLVGRAIFGMGGECINICQSTIIIKWFYKSQMALPLGLALTSSQISSVLNGVISPRLVSSSQSSPALWLGVVVCVISFIGSVILIAIDRQNDETQQVQNHEDKSGEAYSLSWSSVKELNSLYWLITAITVILYSVVFPFHYIESGFLTSTAFSTLPKEESRKMAGLFMSIPFALSSFLIPAIGAFMDKYGQRGYLCLLSAILALVSMVMFIMLPPLFPLIVLGCTYSLLAAVVWPTISMVVNKSVVGLAYGITFSLQNVFLTVIPIIVARIFRNSKDYFQAIIFLAELAMLGIIISIVLLWVNSYKKNIINVSEFGDDEPENKVKQD